MTTPSGQKRGGSFVGGLDGFTFTNPNHVSDKFLKLRWKTKPDAGPKRPDPAPPKQEAVN